ncbi:MAG: hypothetical protein FJ398_24905 [Verrucomicrobia bacterium]|nr:hypothetical protein [Verrucomicrobiota bacterium]
MVCEQRNEVEAYLSSLERLRALKKDRLINDVRAWRLLTANGRRAEAIDRARDFAVAPATGLETLQLTQAYLALGLREAAQRLLERFTVEFSFLDELWILYANLLIAAEQWDKLRQLALQIRLDESVRERLSDLSYFLEGRVELAQQRRSAASQAFSQIGVGPAPHPTLALAMAPHLARWGYGDKARSVLESVERFNNKDLAYWDALSALAFELKNSELLLKSTEKALALSPQSWVARNNHAAALVVNRHRPEKAIQHTLPLFIERPEVSAIRINHALALIQNHRHAEADPLLAGINPLGLTESERAFYNLGCLAVLVHQGRFKLAQAFLGELDDRYLFPLQQEVLGQLRETLAGAR